MAEGPRPDAGFVFMAARVVRCPQCGFVLRLDPSTLASTRSFGKQDLVRPRSFRSLFIDLSAMRDASDACCLVIAADDGYDAVIPGPDRPEILLAAQLPAAEGVAWVAKPTIFGTCATQI